MPNLLDELDERLEEGLPDWTSDWFVVHTLPDDAPEFPEHPYGSREWKNFLADRDDLKAVWELGDGKGDYDELVNAGLLDPKASITFTFTLYAITDKARALNAERSKEGQIAQLEAELKRLKGK